MLHYYLKILIYVHPPIYAPHGTQIVLKRCKSHLNDETSIREARMVPCYLASCHNNTIGKLEDEYTRSYRY